MTTPRFFVEEDAIENEYITIRDKDQLKKMQKVLRLHSGDSIEVFDGTGILYIAQIEILTKSYCTCTIQQSLESTFSPRFLITLAQALPKAGKLDSVIRMNTEVGIHAILPFESDFSIVKKSHFKDTKLERFCRVIIEACRQSERTKLPELLKPVSFDDILNYPADKKILCTARDSTNSVSLCKSVKDLNTGSHVLLIVGPEGGFSQNEIEKAYTHSIDLVHIPTPVLRTETAGLVATSVLLAGCD
jgi:16S rRNA (uracil1498-N3)-methyltransferase